MSKKPELTAAERALPYAGFYDLPIALIPEEEPAVLTIGPIDPSLVLKIEDHNDLFRPGYLPCEIGYCVMPDGIGLPASRTEVLDMIPKMFEQWFTWYSLGDLRYRIWDPEDHYYTYRQIWEKTLDQGLPTRERTWDAVYHMLKDIDPNSGELVLELRYPHGLGYKREKMNTDTCATLIRANSRSPVPGQGVAAIATHFVREILDDIELRFRFWIDYGPVDGRLVKLVPDGVSVLEEVPMDLFAHNPKELGHLAVILPQICVENEDS